MTPNRPRFALQGALLMLTMVSMAGILGKASCSAHAAEHLPKPQGDLPAPKAGETRTPLQIPAATLRSLRKSQSLYQTSVSKFSVIRVQAARCKRPYPIENEMKPTFSN